MNDQRPDDSRTLYVHGLRLKLRRGNLHFTHRGTERAIHVGAWGDDLVDALEYAIQADECERRGRTHHVHAAEPAVSTDDHFGLSPRS